MTDMPETAKRWSVFSPVLMKSDQEPPAEEVANQAALMRRRASEAEALRELADMACPEDLKEWGKRHGIAVFAEMTWEAGFAAGYSAGLARLERRGN